LKQRNGHGEQVIHAQEFSREHALAEEFVSLVYPTHWRTQLAALVLAMGAADPGAGRQRGLIDYRRARSAILRALDRERQPALYSSKGQS
jgi:hypothetical protein